MASKELIKIANYLISTYSLGKFAGTDDEEGLAWQDKDPWESRVPAAATSEEPEEEAWDESWEESDEEDEEPGDYGNWPVIPSAKSEEPNTDLEEEFRREQFMKNFLDADMRKIRTKKDYKGEYKPWQH